MEHGTSFNLTQALTCWRENLSQSPGITPDDIRELESHLMDSMTVLQAESLSEEEAFLLAKRRMGRPELLEAEFAKGNADRIWLMRAIWMLVGYLLVSFTLRVANNGILASAFFAHWMKWTNWTLLIPCGLIVIVLCFFYLQLLSNSAKLNEITRFTLKHPTRAIVTFFGAVLGVNILHSLSMIAFIEPANRPMILEHLWLKILPSFPYVAAVAALIYLRRKMPQANPSTPCTK